MQSQENATKVRSNSRTLTCDDSAIRVIRIPTGAVTSETFRNTFQDCNRLVRGPVPRRLLATSWSRLEIFRKNIYEIVNAKRDLEHITKK